MSHTPYNKKTHNQFLKELETKNSFYREGLFKVVGEYSGVNNKIELETKFGNVSVKAGSLLSGLKFTIESAVDKSEFAKNVIKDLYGEAFDLSKLIYTRSRDNILIGCKKHGFVSVKYNNLMNSRGCPKCGVEYWKQCSKSNGGWEHSKWENKSKYSENFDSFKVYIIRCWNEEEEFYKIGKTFTTIEERMKGYSLNTVMPYNWEVFKIMPLDNAKDVCKLELECHKHFKKYKYIPKIYFSGYQECFSKID